MIISVCKDKQTPLYPYITVKVASVTVENATFTESLFIPSSHPDSPNRASTINNNVNHKFVRRMKSYVAMIGPQDFDGQQHSVRFSGSRNCHHCHINVTNDDINEASEELFIVQLSLAHSLNPNLITLSRNASIGIIDDDDRKLDETE
jgi:hypothetical protein